MTTLNKHQDRYNRLMKLYDQLNYALLGEETEMKYEYMRLKKVVIEEIKKIQQRRGAEEYNG